MNWNILHDSPGKYEAVLFVETGNGRLSTEWILTNCLQNMWLEMSPPRFCYLSSVAHIFPSHGFTRSWWRPENFRSDAFATWNPLVSGFLVSSIAQPSKSWLKAQVMKYHINWDIYSIWWWLWIVFTYRRKVDNGEIWIISFVIKFPFQLVLNNVNF
jgi:hypothetical protein